MSILSLQSPANEPASPFDAIRRVDSNGVEYWSGRDLMGLLGYPRWSDFNSVIDRAKLACKNSGNPVTEHFTGIELKKPGSKGRPSMDYFMTRYGCYLVALNGDPSKAEIAQAQSYFATKTREAETVIPRQNDELEALRMQVKIMECQASIARDNRKVLEVGSSIASLHGVGILALILGRPEAVVREKETQFESVVMDENGKQLAVFRGKSLAQLGKELGFKTGKQFQKWLESCDKGDLVSKAMRPVQTDYIPEEFVDEVRRLWANKSGDRQMLLGE